MADVAPAPQKYRLPPGLIRPRGLDLPHLCTMTASCLQRSALALFRAGLLPRRATLLALIWSTRLSRFGFALWRRRRERRRRLRDALMLARSEGRAKLARNRAV